MRPLELAEDYLVDPESGLKAIITFMQLEADQQAGAGRYKRSATRKAHRNGTVESSHSEQACLTGILVLRKLYWMQLLNRIFKEYPRERSSRSSQSLA